MDLSINSPNWEHIITIGYILIGTMIIGTVQVIAYIRNWRKGGRK